MDAKPTNSAPYWEGAEAREFERSEFDKMLSVGVIELAQTKWVASMVFAPKKNGSLRFRVVYRKINSVLTREVYLLAFIDDCIE